MIVRTFKTSNNSLQVDRFLIQEENGLSWKAKGLLVYLLQEKSGFNISINDLAALSSDGPSAIRSGLKELMQAGYVNQERERQSDGTYGQSFYNIYERPEMNPKFKKAGAGE